MAIVPDLCREQFTGKRQWVQAIIVKTNHHPHRKTNFHFSEGVKYNTGISRLGIRATASRTGSCYQPVRLTEDKGYSFYQQRVTSLSEKAGAIRQDIVVLV